MRQEDEEQMALDLYRLESGQLPGTVTRVTPDPPDFLVTAPDGRRVAVEMTRYHQDPVRPRKGSAGLTHESIAGLVMTHAQQLFEGAHPGLFVRVSVFFQHGQLHRGKVRQYGKRLADLVSNILPADPLQSELATQAEAEWEGLEAFGLSDVIVNVMVWRHRSFSRGDWEPDRVGTASLDTNQVLLFVRGKEEELKEYRARYDECWLIVHTPWMSPAGFIDLQALGPKMFTSDFDLVVVLDTFDGRSVVVA